MSESVKVNIDKRDYNLVGDKELINRSANEVDSQIKQLRQGNQEQSDYTLSILAALNVAEKYFQNFKNSERDKKYLTAQLDKMAEFVENELL